MQTGYGKKKMKTQGFTRLIKGHFYLKPIELVWNEMDRRIKVQKITRGKH